MLFKIAVIAAIVASVASVALADGGVGPLGTRNAHPLEYINIRGIEDLRQRSAAALSVSPDSFSGNEGWVTVSWTGLPVTDTNQFVVGKAPKYWVGAYSPSNPNVTETAPVKYRGVKDTTKASGSMQFRIFNMRAAWAFGLFTGGFDSPQLLAMSSPVKFENYEYPLQGRLALTGEGHLSMRVSWVSGYEVGATVRFGVQSGRYSQSSAADSTVTYGASELCGAPASTVGFRDPGWLHSAKISFAPGQVKPGQTIYYQFGSTTIENWSDEFNYTVPQPVGPTVRADVIAFGDMGIGYVDQSTDTGHHIEPESLLTTANMVKWLNETQMIVHIGDLSYARGYAADWERFGEQIQPVATRVPYMVGVGNHERDYPKSGSRYPTATDSGGECGLPAEARFPMPAPWQSGSRDPSTGMRSDVAWYSFDHANVHWVMMSTEHPFDTDSPQYKFLEADLAAVDRSRTPWVIFTGHRPMYIDSTNDTPSTGDQTVAEALRKYIEPLLFKAEVDLALWGHHHSFQQSCPGLFATECNKGKTTHAVIGMAGMGLTTNIEHKRPNYMVFVDDEHYGYSRIQTTETTLTMSYYHNSEDQPVRQFTLSH